MSNSNNSSNNSSINSGTDNVVITQTCIDKNKLMFQEGENVLCYHGPLLYEAKCLRAEMRNKTPHYLIHYSGWNKNWDEWVNSSRILKLNEDSLKKQQELLAIHGNSKIITKVNKSNNRKSVLTEKQTDSNEVEKADNNLNAPSPSSNQTLKINSSLNNLSSDSKKRKKIEESSDQDDYTIKSDVSIKITEELRQILLEDFQNIVHNNKLVNIPAINTVEMILNDYLVYKLEKQFDKNVITAIVEGIKDYFNAALPIKLLYKFEKIQYIDIFKNSSKRPSQIYGSMHLLRLLAKIGDFLSFTYWDEVCIKQLTLHIEDVIKYLNEYKSTLFQSKIYINASSNYLQKCSNASLTN